MIPYLFPEDALSFVGGGLGVFDKAISCKVVEHINAQLDLSLEILQEDRLYPQLKVGSIIVCKPNITDDVQPFVVESIEKTIDGNINIYAPHIAQYRSKIIPIRPFNATGIQDAIENIYLNSLETNIFNFTTDKTSMAAIEYTIPKSMRSIMGGEEGSLLDVYGGEYLYDKLDIKLLNRRGRTESAIKIMFGYNMVEYNESDFFDWSKSITGVLPYFKNDETYIEGNIQYSSNVDFYKYKKTIPLDVTDKFEDVVPTIEEVNSEGLRYLNNSGLPLVTIKASFDDITTLPMFKSLRDQYRYLKLGDKVEVINNMFNTQYTTRIIETDYNVLGDYYNSITIGDATGTINDAIRNTVQIPDAMAGGTYRFDLLWENENQTSSFAAQTIPVNLASYKMLLITFKVGNNINEFTNEIFEIGVTRNMMIAWATIRGREVTTSANGVTFGNGYLYAAYGNVTKSNNANHCIPCYIYGIG